MFQHPTGAALYVVKREPDGTSVSYRCKVLFMHHLMGVSEIGDYLGVSRQRVTQLAKLKGFPEPVVRLASGPVWESADVERWARETGRLGDG